MAVYYDEPSSQYFTIPNESDYDFSTAISLTGWFRHNGLWKNSWENFISKGDSSWRLSRYSGGGNRGIHWATSGTSGGGGGSLNYDGIVDDDQLHFLGVTFQAGSPGSKYIFLDGSYVATDTAVTGTCNTDGFSVLIGENSEQTGRHFDGLMYDWHIYNRQLSFAELTYLWRAHGGAILNGLVSRWIGNQGAPSVVVASMSDVAVLENDAVPSNSPTWAETPTPVRRRRVA